MKKVFFMYLMVLSMVSKAQDCYILAWSDEFDGTSLDSSKWRCQIGNGYPDSWGWGNGEEQYYTNYTDNIQVSNGTLKITANNNSTGGFSYSSARLRTKGLFDFKYGYVDIRFKVPSGQGLWPAFWMLPTDEVYGPWPASGEIDIMENYGQNQSMTSSLHYSDWGGNHVMATQGYGMSTDQWHEVMMLWTQDQIVTFLDSWTNGWITTYTPSDLGGPWVFNERFYLILNLALGGSAGTISSSFPKDFEIDYIRVYQKKEDITIQGPAEVRAGSANNKFYLPASSGTTYTWTVPADAEITSGQGTNEITVTMGSTAGNITCHVTGWSGDQAGVTTNCGDYDYSHAVTIKSAECTVMIENYDDMQHTVQSDVNPANGIFKPFVSNPGSSSVNASTFCSMFARSGSPQWDSYMLDLNKAIDADLLRNGTESLMVDVYTNANVGAGIPITIQLTNKANNTGYPKGIFGQFGGTVTKQNQWETVTLKYLDTPDWSVQASDVDQLVVLPYPDSHTTDMYYFDNIRMTNNKLNNNPAITGDTTVYYRAGDGPYTYSFSAPQGSVYEWSVSSGASITGGQGTDAAEIIFDDPGQGLNAITVTLKNTTASGCVKTLTKSVEVNNTVGVHKVLKDELYEIYPNPFKDYVTILLNDGINSITIYDMDGSEIEYLNVRGEKQLQTGSSLGKGIYLMKITGTHQIRYEKLVKQ